MDDDTMGRERKLCPDCGETKSSDEFYRNRGRGDGLALECKECQSERGILIRKRARLRVLLHYSGGTMRCACCGESRVDFLTIDHPNRDGFRERKLFRGPFIRHLIASGLPPGYRVLCYNCNCSIGFYGSCPHQTGRSQFDGIEAAPDTPPGPSKGDAHWNAQLTGELVQEIRAHERYSTTWARPFAQLHGVELQTVKHIWANRKRYDRAYEPIVRARIEAAVKERQAKKERLEIALDADKWS